MTPKRASPPAIRSARASLLALVLAIVSGLAPLLAIAPSTAADPWVIDNPDGTSDAVWNFTNPADYALSNAQIAGGVASLRSQTIWWNSTTAAEFAGPDSATNVDLARWPGDVTLAATTGAPTLLVLQPAAAGEDAWLDRNNQNANHGADTTMVLDGRNPQSRPILRFDLSALPAGAVVDAGTLYLYESGGVGASFVANVYQATASWNEMQVTWNDRVTGTAWAAAGGDFNNHVIGQTTLDNAAGWRSWNVTQLVDLWYRGALVNNGLLLNAASTGADADKTFYTSDYNGNPALRPRLEIAYRLLGATGEYVSRVGGPGTNAAWQSIGWNPSTRSLVADEFNGASLDPKWSWTNVPPSYDVGTTTPGHLRVSSTVNSEILGATFTGNALWDAVVGDFTATMKFNSNPNQGGEKVGLMAMLTERDWYAVGKHWNGGTGTVNWRVRSTVDAATTTRVDVNSGNPTPAWVRIARVGNSFTASTSSDGVAWTVQDTYTPAFEYPLEIRLAFYIADGLSGTALTADADYVRVTHGNDATVSVQTRIGDTTPVDVTWSAWSGPYASPAGSALAGTSRYVDYRLSFSVTSPDHTPVVGDVNVSWQNYVASGTLETADFVPGDLEEWGNFTVVDAPNGQSVAYAYSLDSGGVWTPAVPPADLRPVSIATGRIRLRASLSTADTLVTPTISEMRLGYRHALDHFDVIASASAAAGAPFSVTVTAKDGANVTLTGWTGTASLAAVLLDGVTPGGGVLGVTSLAITSGGTATIATQSYTRAETIRIRATFGAAFGLSAPVVVSAGPVARVDVTPPSAAFLPFDTLVFAASAFDAWNNSVPGAAFSWAVTNGVGTLNTSAGPSVTFTAQPPPGVNGTVEATSGGITGVASVSIVTGTRPWILFASPADNAHVTGLVLIAYTNSSDTILVTFAYDAGVGWILIGSTAVINGTFVWDTAGLDAAGVSLRATVENNRTITNATLVTGLEIDNTPPTIALGAITDDQGGSGTFTIAYATDADVVRVDFTYFDGAWRALGTDLSIDGSFVWTPGSPINGVTLRAVAVDEVALAGADQRQGVGTRVVGTNPPAIAPIPEILVRMGTPYDLNLTAYLSDPDTPLGGLTVSTSDAANVTAFPGSYPALRAQYGMAGTYDVTLWVSDGTDTAWRIVRIVASSANPPNLVSPLGTAVFDEDTTLANALGPLTGRFGDLDGDALTFAVLDAGTVLWRLNANSTLDLWALPEWSGSETLRVRATDPSGGFAEAPLVVLVLPVNDAPVLAALARLQWDAGETRTFDLTPFIADVDTNLSQIAVTTDTQYARVNGRTVSMAFPFDWTEAQVTVTVSDGTLAASQLLRVTLLPPWWKSPLFLPIPPAALVAVIGVFAQRSRWRPAKAFLVDQKNELLREFTIDPACDVSWDQARGAGALDAVDKAVKVSRYHAQTVRGDALGLVLLAYGPVTEQQIEFAREMLVNIQDKFEERVKAQIAETRSSAEALDAQAGQLDASRRAFETRSRAFSNMFDAWTTAQAKMAAEAIALREKAGDIENREANLAEGRRTIEESRAQLRQDREEFNALAKTLEGELRRRQGELDEREAAFRDREAKFGEEYRTFDGIRQQKMEWIASKDVELESKEHTLTEKESAVKSQAEENARGLADLAAREEGLEIEGDRIERARQELEARKGQLDALAHELDARGAALRGEEARKAEEYRNWQSSIESQEAVLKQQREAFGAEMTAGREAASRTDASLIGRDEEVREREGKVRAEIDWVHRTKGDLELRATSAQATLDEARVLKAEADAAREAMARQSADLDAREQSLRRGIAGLEDEVARRTEAVRVEEAALVERRSSVEADLAARSAKVQESEADLARRVETYEEKAVSLLSREGSLEEMQEIASQDRAGLDVLRAEFEAGRLDVAQGQRRNEEEADRLRTETDALHKRVATREAELQAEQDRLIQESRSLQDTLGAHAQALAAREQAIGAQEVELRGRLEGLEVREREVEFRDRQSMTHMKDLAAKGSELDAKQKDLAAREVNLQAATKKFADEEGATRKQWAELDQALRGQESRLKTESESSAAQIALRAAEVDRRESALIAATRQAEQERAQLAEQSKASATRTAEADAALRQAEERMAELRAMEDEVLRLRHAVEAERTAWEPKRQAEEHQLLAMREASAEEARRAEQTIQDARQRASIAEESEKSARRKLEELTEREAQIAARRTEVEKAERTLEGRMSELQEASRKLSGRELEVQTLDKDREARESRAQARAKDLAAAEHDLLARRQSLEADAARWSKAQAELASQRQAFEARAAAGEARIAEIAEREKRAAEREVLIKGREATLPAREAELAKRETDLKSQESSLNAEARGLESLQGELDARKMTIDGELRAANAAREEAERQRTDAGKGKAQAESMQAEVSKNMKFLQKKAVDILDREEQTRKREVKLEEMEKILESQVEVVEAQKNAFEIEREELQTKVDRLQAEVDRTRAKLSDAEKASKAGAAGEESRKDVENRLKIIQRKAMELLDREEKVRVREEELRDRAEKLGVKS